MNLTTQTLEAVAKTYDVTLDSSHWAGVLDELNHQVGSIGCNVIVSDHTFAELTTINVSTKLKSAAKHFQEQGYVDELELMMPNLQGIGPHQNFISSYDLYLEHNRIHGTSFNPDKYEKWVASKYGVTET